MMAMMIKMIRIRRWNTIFCALYVTCAVSVIIFQYRQAKWGDNDNYHGHKSLFDLNQNLMKNEQVIRFLIQLTCSNQYVLTKLLTARAFHHMGKIIILHQN